MRRNETGGFVTYKRGKIIVSVSDEDMVFHVYHIMNPFYFDKKIEIIQNAENFNYRIEKDLEKDIITIESKNFSKRNYRGTSKEDLKKAIYTYLKEETGMELSWGTSIGVRPTKIATRMMEEGKNIDEIRNAYFEDYYIRHDKADLCFEIARREMSVKNRARRQLEKNSTGIYIHMPFCPTRCAYCSFLAYASGNGKLLLEYADLLIYEIEETRKMMDELDLKPSFIYFGGGTPTSPEDEIFRRIMKSIHDNFVKGYEIMEYTCEAGRADTLSEDKLKAMKEYGVTRISINPQSFNEDTLMNLNRPSNNYEIIDKMALARKLDFNNINMDIILGLKGEGVAETANTLNNLKVLSPESVTVHGLSIKRGSHYMEEDIKGYPDGETLRKMYEMTYETLREMKLNPYYLYRQKNTLNNAENTGFSKEGFENYYNITMMEELDSIVGIGASAVSKVVLEEPVDGESIKRYSAYKDIILYKDNIEEVIEKKKKLFSLNKYK